MLSEISLVAQYNVTYVTKTDGGARYPKGYRRQFTFANTKQLNVSKYRS